MSKRLALFGFPGGNTSRYWCLHLLVKPRCWSWGFSQLREGYVTSFGLGPFFLLCWETHRRIQYGRKK